MAHKGLICHSALTDMTCFLFFMFNFPILLWVSTPEACIERERTGIPPEYTDCHSNKGVLHSYTHLAYILTQIVVKQTWTGAENNLQSKHGRGETGCSGCSLYTRSSRRAFSPSPEICPPTVPPAPCVKLGSAACL